MKILVSLPAPMFHAGGSELKGVRFVHEVFLIDHLVQNILLFSVAVSFGVIHNGGEEGGGGGSRDVNFLLVRLLIDVFVLVLFVRFCIFIFFVLRPILILRRLLLRLRISPLFFHLILTLIIFTFGIIIFRFSIILVIFFVEICFRIFFLRHSLTF